MENKIYSINGPVVTIKGKTDLAMMEMVYVGKSRLVGEVIRMNDKETTIQVYEETGGLKAGEPVESTGGPLSVTLGPGILRNIYDGIQRPLPAIESHMGSFIERGAHEPSLDTAAKWDVTVNVKAGDTLTGGQIYATCPETPAIQHRCMVPPEVCGTVTWAAENGQLHRQRPHRQTDRRQGPGTHPDPVPEVAYPHPAPGSRAYDLAPSADHWSACYRYHVPAGQGRRRCHPRRFRHRQDHDPAPARKVVRCRHHHLRRLRRTRQRDDPGACRSSASWWTPAPARA